MGVVHPACIDFSEDDVLRLLHKAFQKVRAGCVHHGLRLFLCFWSIYISRVSTIADPIRSSKYHLDPYYFWYMTGISPFPQGLLPARASTFGDWTCSRLWPSDNLSIVVRCNIAIKSRSIHCTLIAFSVKSMRSLATTLNIIVHFNTAIRLKFVRCANDFWTGVCLLLKYNPQLCKVLHSKVLYPCIII